MSVVVMPTVRGYVCFVCLLPFPSLAELYAHFFGVCHNHETLKMCGVDLLMCDLCHARAQHQQLLLLAPRPAASYFHVRSHPLPVTVTSAQIAQMFEPEANAFYHNHRDIHWEWFLWSTTSEEEDDEEAVELLD